MKDDHLQIEDDKSRQGDDFTAAAGNDEGVENEESMPRIGYCEALCTRGVVMWGLTFFCIKFAVYSLLLWMPLFLNEELGYDQQ